MKLAALYEAYCKANEDYLDFVEQLTETDFAILIPDVITFELVSGKERFEQLMKAANKLQESQSQTDNIKDLKYLLMDSLFLANDLAYFYKINEPGRFKLRVLNAVNKRRRTEFFKEGSAFDGNCIEGKMQ